MFFPYIVFFFLFNSPRKPSPLRRCTLYAGTRRDGFAGGHRLRRNYKPTPPHQLTLYGLRCPRTVFVSREAIILPCNEYRRNFLIIKRPSNELGVLAQRASEMRSCRDATTTPAGPAVIRPRRGLVNGIVQTTVAFSGIRDIFYSSLSVIFVLEMRY